MSKSGSQPSGAELQEKPQETPVDPPAKAPANAPIYTEAQLQEKIKEATAKEMSQLRKGESERYKKLETDFLTLKAEKLELEGRVEDVEVYKAQIAELDALKTADLPTEAKAYTKLMASLKENETRGLKEVKSLKERLEKYEATDKETLISNLATKLSISKDTLNKFPIEHLKDLATEADSKPETKVDETKVESDTTKTEPIDKMPAPETGAIQSGGGLPDKEFWKAYGQPGFNATPADHKRAGEIRNRALKGG
jgi:formate dehydrogenase maturation protein FdhE